MEALGRITDAEGRRCGCRNIDDNRRDPLNFSEAVAHHWPSNEYARIQ